MANTESTRAGGSEPSLLVRAVWFVLVGWWATGLWLSVAWLLNVTVVGLPLGIRMINTVPKVLSLKERDFVDETGTPSEQPHGLVVRGVYFVFVGWWASGVWTGVAYLFTLSVVGIPVAVWMYNKLPYVVSLYEY
ncbi:YccF domain-containing protein [Halobaculum sp. D14]|uniref:YccF domain-containing protein n=1 Tax=unclassified Halobaculum TaxID=2640896 RepID=UPI003EBE053F